jgi:hypothetical protein
VVAVANTIRDTNAVFPKKIPAGTAALGQLDSVIPKMAETNARTHEPEASRI